MKTAKSFFCMFLLVACLLQCAKEKIIVRDYPRFGSTIIKNIYAGGVVIEADLLTLGNPPLVDHGFIWNDNKNLTIENSEILSLGPDAGKGRFGAIITSAMRATARYYIRPFVKTEDIIVYGQQLSFTSLGSSSPSIEIISPELVTWGDTVLIKGRNFSSKENNNVKVGNVRAVVLSATATELKVIIPGNITVLNPPVSIEVLGNIGTSFSVVTMKPHTIEHFTPTSGALNDTVKVYGKFPYAKPEVFLGDKKATVLEFSQSRISFRVPYKVPKGENILSIKNGEIMSTAVEKFIRTAPEILALKPHQIGYYDTLTIIGKNFGLQAGSNQVTIGGYISTIVGIKKDTLKVIMPWAFYAQEYPIVEIEYKEQKATSINLLAVKSPAINSITPAIGYPGDWITMKGRNFGKGNVVTVDNVPAESLASDMSELKFKVPNLIQTNDPGVSIFSAGKSDELKGALKSPWRRVASFPIKGGIRKAATFVIGTNGYVMTGIEGTSILNKKVSRFNQIGMQWETLADFPGEARYDAFGIAFEGKGYLMGGRSVSKPLVDFWVYDEQLNTWTERGVAPFHAVGGAVISNELYVISTEKYILDINGNVGGYGPGGGVWKYNVTSNTWVELNAPGHGSDPAKRFYFEMNNNLYVGVMTVFSEYNLYKFDPVNASWSLLGATPFTAGTAPVGFAVNGNGYLLDGNGFYKYSPDSNLWVQLCPSLGYIWSGGNLTVFKIGNNVYTGLGKYNWAYHLSSSLKQYKDIFFEFTALE